MRTSPWATSARVLFLLTAAWVLFTDQVFGLPPPLASAANLYRTLLDPWWTQHATLFTVPRDRLFALDLAVRMVLGVGIPVGWCVATRAAFSHVGLGWTAPAWRITALAVAVSVPAGLALGAGGLKPTVDLSYVMTALGTFPQHLFVFGLGLALLAPPQTTAPSWRSPPSPGEWPALLTLAAIFGATHLGRPTLLEALMSFPGGLLTAFATLRARSIWPAVLAHLSLNGTVLLVQALFR
jgi:membrane protease YdiL (CAAX protease family)